MHFDLSKAAPREIYNLMIGLVTPRPIALVTSRSLEGRLNAAPFSAYNYLGVDPPIVAIGVANRPGPGVVGKDTARKRRPVWNALSMRRSKSDERD
jgi:flavin reductase (DIM6/NTAB) family NADH-FMN oxidoreductase RutF